MNVARKLALLAGVLSLSALAAPVASESAPSVGGWALLENYAVDSPEGKSVKVAPFLTDTRGKAVPRGPWLNHPLKVTAETNAAYVLSDGQARAWLPKRNLGAKAVFPLRRDGETRRLERELGGNTVWANGQPRFPCEIVTGYHASVTVKSARVASVWRVADGSSSSGGRLRGGAILVMLREPRGVRWLYAELNRTLESRSGQLSAQAPRRCTKLPALYANVDDLRRTLTPTRPAAAPALPNDPDAAEKALVGWTRAQVLARCGSPDEAGSLAEIMKLSAWQYGSDPYSMILFTFGPDGRVTRASIARSP